MCRRISPARPRLPSWEPQGNSFLCRKRFCLERTGVTSFICQGNYLMSVSVPLGGAGALHLCRGCGAGFDPLQAALAPPLAHAKQHPTRTRRVGKKPSKELCDRVLAQATPTLPLHGWSSRTYGSCQGAGLRGKPSTGMPACGRAADLMLCFVSGQSLCSPSLYLGLATFDWPTALLRSRLVSALSVWGSRARNDRNRGEVMTLLPDHTGRLYKL